MESSIYFILTLVIIFGLSYIKDKLYYNGVTRSDGYTVFNASIYLEIFLTIFYLSASIGSFYWLLKIAEIEWYMYIVESIWCIYFLFKGLFIFLARNNEIRIKSNHIVIRNNNGEKNYKIKSAKKDTSLAHKWIFTLENHEKIEIDLEDLELDDYGSKLENYLIKNNLYG